MALYHSTIWWFDALSCKTTPEVQPYNWLSPSLLQHAMLFSPSLLLGTLSFVGEPRSDSLSSYTGLE